MILMDRCRVDTRVSFVQNSREFHAKRVSYFAKKYYLFREIPVSRNCILACETKRNETLQIWHGLLNKNTVPFKLKLSSLKCRGLLLNSRLFSTD